MREEVKKNKSAESSKSLKIRELEEQVKLAKAEV